MADRKCSKCGKAKPPSEYGRERGTCNTCRVIQNREYRARKRAARVDPKEHDYQNKNLPPGYSIKGVSHMTRDADGNPLWVKSDRDKAAALSEFIEHIRETFSEFRRLEPLIKAPRKSLDSDLVNVLPIGDAHIGMMTWWQEVGESFDLKTARQIYESAFDSAISTAPAAETLIIINVGDFYHTDGQKNATTKGTPVSVDGRWPKVLRTGIEILRYAVKRGLETHKRVKVINAAGNHDAEATITLTIALEMLFEGNPRVEIDPTPAKHIYFRHGLCLLGITHGDTSKASELPMIMAIDRRDDWGETEYRHWYTGHVHHDTLKDYAGATVETLRVLGPADAWHKGQGYRSGRDIKLDTWHKTDGHIQRNKFGIRAILAKK